MREWLYLKYSQKPRRTIMLAICVINLILILLAAWIISAFAIHDNVQRGFFTSVYQTFTMILDAGCIEAIVTDPGQTNVFLIIFCLVIIVISMITFTGALIGFATNIISTIINEAFTNNKKLMISQHLLILGWNNRASEIVNDLLYRPGNQKVVVITEGEKDEITDEVKEKIHHTIERENRKLRDELMSQGWIKSKFLYFRDKLRDNVTFIVRTGDIFSSIQLNNAQIKRAEAVIILSNGITNNTYPADFTGSFDEKQNSDSRIIKALMQVIELTNDSASIDNQKIVVEIENDWTEKLVEMIIKTKQQSGKCRVVPFRMHRVMGQLLSQFSLMPALNMAYQDLFSNKGATFYSVKQNKVNRSVDYIEQYLSQHHQAIPLTFLKDDLEGQDYFYYVADNEEDIQESGNVRNEFCDVELNRNYWMNEKYVLILGSNSKIENVMNGFRSFCNEWTNEEHPRILHITIIDEEEKLKHFNYYHAYPFVENCIAADVFEQSKIIKEITTFINAYPHDSSILILSDDLARDDDVDSKALTYLIDAKDTINRVRANKMDENFNIDIVVEIIDPKHYDILKSYDVHNVVISNRYISKMITQISENYALYNFYADIMAYDSEGSSYEGKEVYVKNAGEYFEKLPPPGTSVDSLIRTAFAKSREFWGHEGDYAVLIGYVDPQNKMHIFSGDQLNQEVTLTAEDRLIIFSNH